MPLGFYLLLGGYPTPSKSWIIFSPTKLNEKKNEKRICGKMKTN
jgi:hypothetical protein